MNKNKAKRNEANRTKKGTLDQKHTEKLEKFEKMSNSIPNKKNKLSRLQGELTKLVAMNPNKYSHHDIRRKSYLKDSIDKLRVKIHSIENCTESLNYIVDTLPILVNYYDNKEIIDNGDEEFVNDTNNSGKKNILSYFMKETYKSADENSDKKKTTKPKKGSSGSGSKTSKPTVPATPPKPQLSKAKLYDNYLCITDTNHKKTALKKSNLCVVDDCEGEMIISHSDGFLTCKKCGYSETVLIATDKPSYKEPTQDSCTYAYKRINHLTEILSQLQAKESTDIPSKVFENILRELKKRKINKDELDIFKLRKILKKLSYRKYYEHVPHILQIINGKEPPNFSRSDELKIKKMFKDIQKPFEIYRPKSRKNFLNYSYVLHKFCELLDLDAYINYFPLLKNNAKLRQHDHIWRNICGYVKWKYYRSI